MVGISLLTLAPGEVGGSETYIRGLLSALARGSGDLDYRVVAQTRASDAAGGLPVQTVGDYRGPRLLQLAAAAADPRPRRALRSADVVHYPLTTRVPHLRSRVVVTLHDVQHLDLPHLFPRAMRVYRHALYDAGARAADRVIVLSEFQRGRVEELLGIPPERLRVVHSGVDPQRVARNSANREPFLLYPAYPWPHKNHDTLFRAFAQLRRARPELRLVLTGGGSYPSLPDGVEAHGLVSPTELGTLYGRAAALVFPSLYEGFGLPPLEAMASSCPVACSNAAALPEIVGDAARLFDPSSVEDIVEAVGDVLAQPAIWVARGRVRCAAFSWERSAAAHEALYRELL